MVSYNISGTLVKVWPPLFDRTDDGKQLFFMRGVIKFSPREFMTEVRYWLQPAALILLKYRTNCQVRGIGFDNEFRIGLQVRQDEEGLAAQRCSESLKGLLLRVTPGPLGALTQKGG